MTPAYLSDRPTLAVLLAGGEGTRLYELVSLEPKAALLPASRRIADFAATSRLRSADCASPRLRP